MAQKKVTVWVQKFADRPNLVLQWHDPITGKRMSKSAGTSDPARAAELAKDLEYELRHNVRPAEPSKLTWADFRKSYEAEVLPGRRDRTREKAGTVFDVFEAVVRPGLLSEIDSRMISRFVQGMRERRKANGKVGLEPITQRNYLVALKTALAWGVEQGLLATLPKFPKIIVPRKRPQPISATDVDKLLAAAPDDAWRAFMLCGWYAGLRLSEALHLRRATSEEWPWLDLQRERIVLPAKFAKANEDQWVPLHEKLRAALTALPVGSDPDKIFDFRSVSQSTRGEPLTRSGISTTIGGFAKKAGVKLSMHRLRKGFGCRVAAELGRGNAPVLHRLMRHSSMQVTLDFYASVDDVLGDAMKELS